MLKEEAEGNNKQGITSRVETLQLDYVAEREPKLDFETSWVQEGTNQCVLLDTFFSAAKPDKSLIFFYAKRTPSGGGCAASDHWSWSCENHRCTVLSIAMLVEAGRRARWVVTYGSAILNIRYAPKG